MAVEGENAAPASPAYVKLDVVFAEVSLPRFLSDQTWYEFRHSTHPVRSILVDRTDMPTEAATAWLQNRRERILGTNVVLASEPEPFFNPELPAEGFFFHLESAPDDVNFFVVVRTIPEFTVFTVRTARSSFGLVHAIIERVTQQVAVPAPVDGWQWRQVKRTWIVVPDGASEPHQYDFDGDGLHVTVKRSTPSRSTETVTSGGSRPTETRVSLRPDGSSVSLRSVRDAEADGTPTLAYAAVITKDSSGVALDARARGAACRMLDTEWSKIVDGTVVRS